MMLIGGYGVKTRTVQSYTNVWDRFTTILHTPSGTTNVSPATGRTHTRTQYRRLRVI